MGRVCCVRCGVTCTSVPSLCEHVIGQKHRNVLYKVAPEELKELGRLQYFLDVYLKDYPILGLEFVEESQVGSSYRYKCLVCDVEDGWMGMVGHILHVEHTERYITRHRNGVPKLPKNLRWEDWKYRVEKIAKMIYDKIGRRQIRCKKPDVDECGTENGALPKEERPPEDPEKQNKEVDKVTRSQGLERVIGNYTVEQQTCMICIVRCTSPMALCGHYMGKIHRRKMELVMPEELKELGRLSHFIHNHMTDLPLLGLEYIVEEKVGPSYQYSCQLCNIDTNVVFMVGHVLDESHIELYIKTHHANLLPRVPKSENDLYIKDLRVCVKWIIEKHGQKQIQIKHVSLSKVTEHKSLPKREGCSRKMLDGEDNESSSKYDSGNSSHAKRRPFPYEKTDLEAIYSSENMSDMSTADGPPLAKRGRVSPEVHQDSLSSSCPVSMYSGSSYNESLQQDTPPCVMDANSTTAVQEFQTNQEFFEYLANFRIKDDEDALLIQTITQNCIRALTNFQKEEMERQTAFRQPEASFAHTHSTDEGSPDIEKAAYQPETPMVHTSKTNSQAPDIPVNRAVSHLLDSNTYLPTKASNPSSNVSSKNEITNFFFNSIKEMDESEVVGIFQKIATTNPEFHGINVPSVMRILKNSGRLKNP